MSDKAVATVNEGIGNVVAQPSNESAALISMIERAASDPSVDITKMERLFDMHERIEGRRAEQLYNASMAAAQAEMPTVTRNQKNEQTNSNYADMFAIADKALPVAHKHGFGLSFSEAKATKDAHIGLACTVTHSGGFSKGYHFDVPFDDKGIKGSTNKTPTHAYGSTMMYGRRYATCGVFNIIIEGLDRDGNPPTDSAITDEQCEAMMKLLIGSDNEPNLLDEFCIAHKLDRLGEFPARNFNAAMNVIRKRRASEAAQ